MKISRRIDLIRQISDELGRRYNWVQAGQFVRAFVPKADVYEGNFHDISEMVSYGLSDVTDSVLAEIVEDLGLDALSDIAASILLPKIWEKSDNLRVFISHLSAEKIKAGRLREEFAKIHCDAFVAHDDIEPTLEWQIQIERALHTMDLFVSLHTTNFKNSVWTQQEIGFAVAKGTKIIAIRMDEDPTGFISKNQALSRGNKRAEQIVSEIEPLLLRDNRTKEKLLAAKNSIDFSDEVPF